MKINEILSMLSEAKSKLDPWAEDMLKVIHSVNSEVSGFNMGSEDGAYVNNATADKIAKKFKDLGYKVSKYADTVVVTSKDDTNKGVIFSNNDDVPGEKALNFWVE